MSADFLLVNNPPTHSNGGFMKDLKSYIVDVVLASIYNAWLTDESMNYNQMSVFRSLVIEELEVFLDGKRFHKLCQGLSDHLKDD